MASVFYTRRAREPETRFLRWATRRGTDDPWLARMLRQKPRMLVAVPDGRQRVVRHGTGPERTIQTGIGPIPVQRQKVRDRATDIPGEKKIRFIEGVTFIDGVAQPDADQNRAA